MKKEVESLHGILDEMFEMSPEMVFEIENEAKEKVKAARLMMVALWVASFALLFGILFLLVHFQLMDYILLFPLVYLLLFEPLRELVEYLPEKEKALIVLQRRDPVRYKDAVRMQYRPIAVRSYTYFVCILMAVLFFTLFRKNISDFVLSNEIAYGFIIFVFSLISIAFSRFLAKKEEVEVFGMKL
ncbi:MAG: hypothetical protein J5498_02950 [Bacteroidales bacterium]|nr:hypothetical protein [Bacteroidales bacterium]